MIKFSIVTAVYNAESTILDTIQSVISGGVDDYEHIIIDGGSTDDTMKIIELNKHNKMIVISESDEGIYDAMNKGIKLARGEWIATLNADDFYSNAILAKLEKEIDSKTQVIHGDLVYLKDGVEDRVAPPLINENYTEFDMPTHHPTTFIRRDLYDKFGLYSTDFKIISDFQLVNNLYREGCIFQYFNEIVTYMRWGGVSAVEWRLRHEETKKLYKIMNLPLGRRFFYSAKCSLAKARNFVKRVILR